MGDYNEVTKSKLLFEHFSGVRNLVQTLGKRTQNNRAMSDEHSSGKSDTSWTGTQSLEEAFNLLEKGWEGPIKDIDRGVVRNNKDLKRRRLIMAAALIFHVSTSFMLPVLYPCRSIAT